MHILSCTCIYDIIFAIVARGSKTWDVGNCGKISEYLSAIYVQKKLYGVRHTMSCVSVLHEAETGRNIIITPTNIIIIMCFKFQNVFHWRNLLSDRID